MIRQVQAELCDVLTETDDMPTVGDAEYAMLWGVFGRECRYVRDIVEDPLYQDRRWVVQWTTDPEFDAECFDVDEAYDWVDRLAPFGEDLRVEVRNVVEDVEVALPKFQPQQTDVELRVVRAAIKDFYDGVHSLPIPKHHRDIVELMRKKGHAGLLSRDRYGFLLNDGQFVLPAQAARVAKKAGQAKRGCRIGLELESRDLW